LAKPIKINDISEEKKITSKWKLFKHSDTDPNCQHCKCTIAENSIPKDEFTIKKKNGGNITIKQITVKRGRYGDCIGWIF